MTDEYFPTYERPSGWNALLPKRTPKKPLENTISCEVAVVGAGYTGLAAARRWAELAADDRIVLLDSSEVGEGSPGRNSGFLVEIMMAGDANIADVSRMLECNRLIGGAIKDLREIIERENIPCGIARIGTYRAAAGRAGIRALAKYRKFLEAANLDHVLLNRNELAQRIGSDFYQTGIYSPHCHMVQPAAMVRGIADSLPLSVSLYENTPAIRLDKAKSGWQITTPNGQVNANQIILANNAYSRKFVRASRRIAVIYTYAALTERLNEEQLRSLGSDSTWGLLPATRVGSTFRRTEDGRILTRAFWGYEKELDNKKVEDVLRKSLRRRFPKLSGADFFAVWSGATGLTINGSPVWGEFEAGLFVSAGCNGGGIVKGTLFGQLLANLANGVSVPNVGSMFGQAAWMPGGALRWAGNELVAAFEKFVGSDEL
ncbi:MAG: FAD-binding oxidoreductase [Gammaproteobacteria bacterium]|nr:FAD-binding oxidoreductase [Gammaproteobacteria bacterium]